MSHFCCIEFSISVVFLVFLSNHWIRIVCDTHEYHHFMPKAVSVFAGRRCMSIMLFDRTTNKLCLCLSATRRYFAASTKGSFYSLYIEGEMQIETIFILQRSLNTHYLDIVIIYNVSIFKLQLKKFNPSGMLNSYNLITMKELYPENGITRFLNILIQKQQHTKNSRWSKSDKIFSYFLFLLSL